MTRSIFENIQYSIIQEINNASITIDIAVAWLTDLKIIEALIEKASGGVKISIIISASELNEKRYINYKKIIDLGGIVLKSGKSDGKDGGFMHHKFCIIDRLTIITGSYNWTGNAITNNENIIIVKDVNEGLKYYSEFESLFKKSKNLFGAFEHDHPKFDCFNYESNAPVPPDAIFDVSKSMFKINKSSNYVYKKIGFPDVSVFRDRVSLSEIYIESTSNRFRPKTVGLLGCIDTIKITAVNDLGDNVQFSTSLWLADEINTKALYCKMIIKCFPIFFLDSLGRPISDIVVRADVFNYNYKLPEDVTIIKNCNY